jgi:hypothetical protein
MLEVKFKDNILDKEKTLLYDEVQFNGKYSNLVRGCGIKTILTKNLITITSLITYKEQQDIIGSI